MQTRLFSRTLSFLFLTSIASAFPNDNDVLAPVHEFVSLGGACDPAVACHYTGLRKAAHPFDQIDCANNIENLIKILDEDFAYFLDKRCFVQRRQSPSYNKYYKLNFVHDFSPDWEKKSDEEKTKHWEDFADRLTRRIDRFREIRNNSGKVFFVRLPSSKIEFGKNRGSDENKKEAQKLKEALTRYFPSLDFTLIIVYYSKSSAPTVVYDENTIEYTIEKNIETLKELVMAISQQWILDGGFP